MKKSVFTFSMICFEKKTFEHDVNAADTVLHQEAAQDENTFTVKFMGTVLTIVRGPGAESGMWVQSFFLDVFM